MVTSSSTILVLTGLALFLIAGFQTMICREASILKQQAFDKAPLYIVIEVVLAAALCLCGSSGLAGTLKPINPLISQRGMSAESFRPDFMSFNHRGHLIPLDLAPLPNH